MTEAHNEISLPFGESFVAPRRSSFWMSFWIFEFFAVFASMFFLPFLIIEGQGVLLVGYFFIPLLAAPFCLLLAVVFRLSTTPTKQGSVSFDGKYVTVYSDEKGMEPLFSAPLVNCQWFFGSSTWATSPNHNAYFFSHSPPNMLLLEFPPWCRTRSVSHGKNSIPPSVVLVAVGATQEKQEQWMRILSEFQVPHNEKREKIRAPLPFAILCAAYCFWIFASFTLALIFTQMLQKFMEACGVPAALALSLAFPFFIPGAFFYIALFPLIYMTHRSLQLDIDRSAFEPAIRWIFLGFVWGPVILLGVLNINILSIAVMFLQGMVLTPFVWKFCNKLEKAQKSHEKVKPPLGVIATVIGLPQDARKEVFDQPATEQPQEAPTWYCEDFPFVHLNFARFMVLSFLLPVALLLLSDLVWKVYLVLVFSLQLQIPGDVITGLAVAFAVDGVMIAVYFFVIFFTYRDWNRYRKSQDENEATILDEIRLRNFHKRLNSMFTFSLAVFCFACWSAPYGRDWTARTVVVVFGVTILLGLASRAASVPFFSVLFSIRKKEKNDSDEFRFKNLRKYQ